MRFTVLFSFVILLQVKANCQVDTAFVPFAAKWETGDSYYFTVTKVKKTWQRKTLTRIDSARYTARFQVLDADTGSYTILWSFKNPLFNSFNLTEASRKKLSRYDSTTVVYKTDAFGAFIGIDNWQEISMMMTDLINELINTLSADSSKKTADLKNSFSPILSVYSSKRGIEQLVFKELLMFHFPFGQQYTIGEIYNYKEQLPVMQNTLPAVGNGVLYIRDADFKKHTCKLVQRLKILPDSANKFLVEYFRNIGVRPEAIQGTVSESTLQINDNNIFEYNYIPGIPIRITVSRETLIDVLEDKVKQTDQTIIEQTAI